MKRFKMLKVLFCLALVVLMVLTVTLPALAASTGTVTITARKGVVSITLAPTSYDFGYLIESSVNNTPSNAFTLGNDGNYNVNTTIQGADALAGGPKKWVLSDTATPGADTYGTKVTPDGVNYTVIQKTNPVVLVNGLAVSGSQTFGLQLLAPTSMSFVEQVSATFTVSAVKV